jgi:hypothetical protein
MSTMPAPSRPRVELRLRLLVRPLGVLGVVASLGVLAAVVGGAALVGGAAPAGALRPHSSQ